VQNIVEICSSLLKLFKIKLVTFLRHAVYFYSRQNLHIPNEI